MVIKQPTVEVKADKIRKKLQQSSIGIAGIGGLGSNAAVALTRCSIGKLVLVDYDAVETSKPIDNAYSFTS